MMREERVLKYTEMLMRALKAQRWQRQAILRGELGLAYAGFCAVSVVVVTLVCNLRGL